MRPLRWILVTALIWGLAAAPRLLPIRVQQARLAMTRAGLMLIYADFGA